MITEIVGFLVLVLLIIGALLIDDHGLHKLEDDDDGPEDLS